jgi:SAM-dependent methyltransferase
MTVEEFARRMIEDPAGFREAMDRRGSDGDSLRAMAGRIDLGQVLRDVQRILLDPGPAPSPFFDYVGRHWPIDADAMVLDVGASCGRHLWDWKECSHEGPPRGLVALDINPIVLTIGALAWEARQSTISPAWIRGDAVKLPFHDGTFTHVMSNVTMILLPFRAALAEFRRVLEPGGRLVFTVEGPGAWSSYWGGARPWSRRRLNLLRGWLGNALMKAGLDWQGRPVLSRLSRHSQFDLGTVDRIVRRAGFVIESCDVNKVYQGQPMVIGVVARKPAGLPGDSAGGETQP